MCRWQYYDQLAAKLGSDANYLFSYDWAYGERAQRITELLKQNAPNTIDTLPEHPGRQQEPRTPQLIMPYLANLQIEPGSVAEARDYLLDWDFQMGMDSGQAALFAEFNARLLAQPVRRSTARRTIRPTITNCGQPCSLMDAAG